MSKTVTKITGSRDVPGDTKFSMLHTYSKRAHCSESLVTIKNTKFPDIAR
jgi:hypothetical protein